MELKTEISGIYKDDTGALLNRNNNGLTAYKKQKALHSTVATTMREISIIKSEIKVLKNDVVEIKKLLSTIEKSSTPFVNN
jgi:hypothetical protein